MKFMEKQIEISVIMIGHKRVDILARAIGSLLRHAKKSSWELILVLNGYYPEVEAYAAGLEENKQLFLKIIRVEECRPGAARNFGIQQAQGKVILFLDDDIELYQDILSSVIQMFKDPKLMVAGGANLTPPDSTAFERATGYAMASFFGAASMRWRYRSFSKICSVSEHALILCNLAIRRELFLNREDQFPQHLVSNEENLLLQRLEEKNALMISSPDLAVYHRRRTTFLGLFQQSFKYGKGRAQNCLYLPSSFHWIYLLPSFVVSYFLVFLLVLNFTFLNKTIFLIPAFFYLTLALFSAIYQLFFTKDFSAFVYQIICYFLIHFGYGIGFLNGVFGWGWRRKKLCEV